MTSSIIGKLRLANGLIQGGLLFLLYRTVAPHQWPATDGPVFASLAAIGVVAPVLIAINLGHMRARSLVSWVLMAAAILAGLMFYDFFRRNGLENRWLWMMTGAHDLVPSFTLVLFIAAGFFIAQSLILAADMDRRLIAGYPAYFDIAWKLAVQAFISFGFVGLMWLALWTGMLMFDLIGITFVRQLIRHDWFCIPVTTLAVACAIHVTDVRVTLVRGIRTVKLTLLAWLLPLMVLFVGGFLASLPFKGIDMLWHTHHTSQILLAAAAWLILLINAVHQDGTDEHAPPKFLRAIAAIAMALILPLAIIAASAVASRVVEYGWTVNLIDITACLIVAACYGFGYLLAAVPVGAPARRLEKTNIAAAFVILAILLALFSPIADPARLSVADQMSRLAGGQVAADKFDYHYLRDYGGRYGMDALVQLRMQAKTPEAKAKIDMAMIRPRIWQPPAPPVAPTARDISANITVYPAGSHLPDSFIRQDWSKLKNEVGAYPTCLYDNMVKCEAFLINDAVNSAPEIILTSRIGEVFGPMTVLKLEDNKWKLFGGLNGANCKSVAQAMRAGNFAIVPATSEDLVVKGAKFQVIHIPECPK